MIRCPGDRPPVNALSHATRTRLANELARAAADPAVKAVVLAGNAEFFSAGADVKEFNTPKMAAEPNLATLLQLFEHSLKPTIAALPLVTPPALILCRPQPVPL